MMLNMAFYIHWMCVRQNALANRFECTVRTMFGVIKNHPTKLWGWFFFGWWNWIPKLNCTNGLTERERDSKMRESVSFYFIALAYLSMFSLFSMLCVALLIKNKGVKKTQILHTEKTMNDGLSGLPFWCQITGVLESRALEGHSERDLNLYIWAIFKSW